MSVRIGVNTGQVVVGTEERLATGDAVNLAARLEQAAAPGEIIMGPQSWRLVRDVVTAEPLEPLRLKGKSQPVVAYRLLQVRDAAHAGTRRAGAPLVGRRRQLRMLREAFAHVAQERSCRLVTVLGVAGVGKSRLTAEFLRGVDARVLTGGCLSYGQGITYWPVVSMVKQLLDAEHGCGGAAGLMSRDAKVTAAVNVLLGEQVAVTSSSEIAWAVRRLFESSGELSPLVAVFDDLHWGEPTLLDLIEHIADFSLGAPVLIVCLARPELLDHRSGWGQGRLNSTTVWLEPLNPAETAALIDELLPAGTETGCTAARTGPGDGGGQPAVRGGDPRADRRVGHPPDRRPADHPGAARRAARSAPRRASALCWSAGRWKGSPSTAAPSRSWRPRNGIFPGG